MESISRGEVTIGITITAIVTVVAVVEEDKAVETSNGRATSIPPRSIKTASSSNRAKVSIINSIRVCIHSRMVLLGLISACLRDRLRPRIISSRARQFNNITLIRMNWATIDKGSLQCRRSHK